MGRRVAPGTVRREEHGRIAADGRADGVYLLHPDGGERHETPKIMVMR